MFRLHSGTLVDRPPNVLTVPASEARSEHVRFDTPSDGTGRRYITNVFWTPMVKATGAARIAGRDSDGYAVLEVQRGGEPAAFESARPGYVRAGAVISLLALLGTAWLLVANARRRTR
jgi:hypothetical protein